jgi:hypothetical protein
MYSAVAERTRRLASVKSPIFPGSNSFVIPYLLSGRANARW